MTQLQVLYTGFRKRQLTPTCDAKVIQVVKEEFWRTYPGEPLEVTTADATSKLDYDLYILYNELPKVINTLQRFDQFKESVAQRLNGVIPQECFYRGKIRTSPSSALRDAEDKPASGEGGQRETPPQEDDTVDYEVFAKQFHAEPPKFTFERLVLSEEVHTRLMEAIAILENRDKLFNQWGLGSIMNPSVLVNLYGDSGTGKTMAAEAIASKLKKPIIRASYAEIESKFHGEGPKRLKGLFLAAKQQDAVLFIDEADSMLSARLQNVSQGSEQAINSMRSQLLMSLESYDGIVIFATNLIENYDKAFLTRLVCVEMKRPDREGRKKIWHNHLYPVGEGVALRIPLASDVDLDALSDYDFCGRDIRNAVKQACVSAVRREKDVVTQEDLLGACKRIRSELDSLKISTGKDRITVRSTTPEERQVVTQNLVKQLTEG